MADLIDEQRGRVVDSPGDNLLAGFASVIENSVKDGYFFMKIKIGRPGSQAEMLQGDMERIALILQLIGHWETPIPKTAKSRIISTPMEDMKKRNARAPAGPDRNYRRAFPGGSGYLCGRSGCQDSRR
ncbi:hypothetical protein D1BOALGB6SA_5093 [Olavius sp. associated proteobacterium Delta 1]|nr:hypothetical protein D1BOALGB6SA_5093 [Olavius sp. associated proteobacterium Delta 1]